MKKIKHVFSIIVAVFSVTSIVAQQSVFVQNDTADNGTVKFRRYNVSINPHSSANEKELLQSTLGISASDSLRLVSTVNDSLGFIHKFYQQYYKGIKVEYATYATHIRKGIIEVINGEFVRVGRPATVPSLSESAALASALKYVNAQQYKWQIPAEETALKELKNNSSATYYPKGEVVICFDYLKTKTYRLAYKFGISAYLPVSSSYIFVDAITGDVIASQNLLFDGNVTTSVPTRYNSTQTITTDQYTSGGITMYRLYETRGTSNVQIQSFNSQRVQSTAHVEFTDANNSWTASNNANMDNAALDAHWATEKIYDYWNTVRVRNSYDGSAAPMISFVHYNEPWEILNGIPQYHTGTDNSTWDGGLHQVYLGDGYVQFNPLTSFDVCAHEFGHGFTEGAQAALFTSGGILINSDNLHPEALALNEGISDIWGAVVENWGTVGKQTWEIGEDIMKNGKPCLRSLVNPKTGGDPTGTAHGGYPDTYHGAYWDNNNASHTNSTVMSHWFYLLSQGGSGTNDLSNSYNVTGIGIIEAASIVWRAEQNYLGTNSQYTDARTAMISAATDLYCANSPEVAAVTNAWYAVGIGAAYSGNVMSVSGSGYLCTTGSYIVANQPSGVSSIAWASSNTSIATINNFGNATKVDNGNTTISAIVIGAASCSTTVFTPIIVGLPTSIGVNVGGGGFSNMEDCGNATDFGVLYNEVDHNYAGSLYVTASNATSLSWTEVSNSSIPYWGWSTSDTGHTLYVSQKYANKYLSLKVTATNACGSINKIYNFNSGTCFVSAPVTADNYLLAPNPAGDNVTVSVNSTSKNSEAVSFAQIRVYDGSGNLKKQIKYASGTRQAQINIADLRPGNYYIEISNGKTAERKPLVVQR